MLVVGRCQDIANIDVFIVGYFVIYLLILQEAPIQSAVHWHENALRSGVHVPPFSHVTVRHSFTVAKMCTYKQYLFGKTLYYYYIAYFSI